MSIIGLIITILKDYSRTGRGLDFQGHRQDQGLRHQCQGQKRGLDLTFKAINRIKNYIFKAEDKTKDLT